MTPRDPGLQASVVAGQPGTVAGQRGRDVGDASVGELIGEVTQDLSMLMRQELALAKAEVKQEAVKAGRAAGMLGGAGFAGYMVLLFASIAAWWGLAEVMAPGWAALIVTAIWAVIGAVLFVLGRQRMREVNPKPERTVETVSEVPETLKGAVRR
jgi:tetrahydromethanopterin S-methyltransferase subunit C